MSRHEELVQVALAAQQKAYAPYSEFRVGAAILGDNGKIYGGCNVENASYGLCICAERTAVVSAVYDGMKRLLAVAVVASCDPPAAPCGACRQVLMEFAGAGDVPVILVSENGTRAETTLQALLPRAFGPADLR